MPLSGQFDAGTHEVTLTMTGALSAGAVSVPGAYWSRQYATRYNGSGGSFAGSVATLAMSTVGVNPGSDSISYDGSDPNFKDAGGLRIAAFSDFPIMEAP